MSILSALLDGQITPATALTEAEEWLGQTVHNIETGVQNDPSVKAAVNTFISDGKAAIAVGTDWAGTALSGILSAYAQEGDALLKKYLPLVTGAAGGPLSAAEMAAAQALVSVGVATVQHGMASVISAPKPTAPVPASK